MNHRLEELKASNKKQKILGISIVLVEVVFVISHGLLGSFYNEDNSTTVAYEQMIPKILLMLCALVGFGLLLSSFRFGSLLGMGSTLIITAITVQFSPLMQKLMFSSIVLNFGSQPDSQMVADNIKTYWNHAQALQVDSSFVIIENTMLCSISLLTVMIALIGKITLGQVVKITVLYTLFWNMGLSLVIKHSISGSVGNDPVYFDAYGGSYVYLFGSCFAVFLNLIYFRKIKLTPPEVTSDRVTLSLAALGNAFIFILFIFLNSSFMDYGPACNARAKLSVFFALTGSIIGTYAGSALAGKGTVGFQQTLLGTLTGGIVVASSAPILVNVSDALIAGSSCGLVSGLCIQLIYSRANKKYVYDTLGLYQTFLIASVASSFIVLPIALIRVDRQTCPSLINRGQDTIFQQLQNSAIVLGVGVVGSIVSGLLILCESDRDAQVEHGKYFNNDFGLYSAESQKGKYEEIKEHPSQPRKQQLIPSEQSEITNQQPKRFAPGQTRDKIIDN